VEKKGKVGASRSPSAVLLINTNEFKDTADADQGGELSESTRRPVISDCWSNLLVTKGLGKGGKEGKYQRRIELPAFISSCHLARVPCWQRMHSAEKTSKNSGVEKKRPCCQKKNPKKGLSRTKER